MPAWLSRALPVGWALCALPLAAQTLCSSTGATPPLALFERFTRAGRDRARGIRGHGLGLALVRAIAMRHGAKLALPRTEKGLTVRIEWPPLPPC